MGVTNGRTADWWTLADEAELELLVHEFVNGWYEHRICCRVCSRGGRWCSHLCDALEVILEWRRGRILHNKAIRLRALQQHEEALLAAV